MKIRSGLVVGALLGSSLLGLGVSTPASAEEVCAGTGTATFIDSSVWYPALVPGGLGADPAPGPNRGTFGVAGACVGSDDISLSGSFVFPNGAQCGRSAGGSGTLDGTGETFSIETAGTVVLITGAEVNGVADATPLLGTSCRADQGGTKNFTIAGAITRRAKCDALIEWNCYYDHDNNSATPDEQCDLWVGGKPPPAGLGVCVASVNNP